MELRLIAGSKTDVGKQREQNEDSCYAMVAESDRHASGLFIVADGMGGYHAGEIASELAVSTIRDALVPLLGPTSAQTTIPLAAQRSDRHKKSGKPEKGKPNEKPNEKREAKVTRPLAETAENAQNDSAATQQLSESLAIEHFADRLREAVEEANAALISYGHEHPDARGLGSTLTAALVIEGTAFIANVGDSRTYLLRDGKLARVTRDHSLVERLVEAGQIEPEDVYEHPNRNLVYRSLGAGKADVEVDIFTEQLKPGDALLLCSDGLWEMVRDPQLESILNEVQNPGEACDLLIVRANENGGEDNITGVLVRAQKA
jgi:protein phosphatase